MADVITLSSSEDEEDVQAKKKPKLTNKETTIILSDEEDVKVEDAQEPKLVCDNNEQDKTDTNTNLITVEAEVYTGHKSDGQCKPTKCVASTTTGGVDNIALKLTAFIEKCLESITLPHIKERLTGTIPKMKGHYEKLQRLNSNMKDLECMLDSNSQTTYDSYKAVVRFSEIFDFLKEKLKTSENEELLSGPKRQLLNKLEKTLLLLRKRIRKLDEAEVDFEEEENSNYIKAGRYKERAQKVFNKICELRKEDPNSGRLAYTNLNFTHSKYPEINKLLNKKYKNTIEFPTYFEMDKCIRNYVDISAMKITEDRLKEEIKFCFEKLGNIMKQRRKLDLYDTHTDFIPDSSIDPALQNEEIEKQLQENKTKGAIKMDEIYEKYTRMQENGVNPNVSSDSDDSDISNSD